MPSVRIWTLESDNDAKVVRCLEEFSERVLLELNPDMPQKNVDRERYHERISPDVADHVLIDRETLRRNNSLRKLGNVLAQFK